MIIRFLKYNGVQAVAYAIDYGGFALLLHVAGLGALASNIGGKLAAGLFAFFVHRRFTFGLTDREGVGGEGFRYFLLLLLNIPVSSVLLVGAKALMPVMIAKLAADALTVVVTFALTQSLVFRMRRRREGQR